MVGGGGGGSLCGKAKKKNIKCSSSIQYKIPMNERERAKPRRLKEKSPRLLSESTMIIGTVVCSPLWTIESSQCKLLKCVSQRPFVIRLQDDAVVIIPFLLRTTKINNVNENTTWITSRNNNIRICKRKTGNIFFFVFQ